MDNKITIEYLIDKINRDGINSLTKEEKDFLDKLYNS